MEKSADRVWHVVADPRGLRFKCCRSLCIPFATWLEIDAYGWIEEIGDYDFFPVRRQSTLMALDSIVPREGKATLISNYKDRNA